MTRDEIPQPARAFYEGMDAFDEGLDGYHGNPYDGRTREGRAWKAGWFARREDWYTNGPISRSGVVPATQGAGSEPSSRPVPTGADGNELDGRQTGETVILAPNKNDAPPVATSEAPSQTEALAS